MTDQTLASLLSACVENPADASSLAALADRLLECSAADRVEVLQGLAGAANRLNSVRGGVDASFEHAPDTRTLMAEYACFDDSDKKEVEYAEQSLRRRVASELPKALEEDRWYAVRFRLVTRPDEMNYHGPGMRRRLLRRMTATVTPLDGGRVRQDS